MPTQLFLYGLLFFFIYNLWNIAKYYQRVQESLDLPLGKSRLSLTLWWYLNHSFMKLYKLLFYIWGMLQNVDIKNNLYKGNHHKKIKYNIVIYYYRLTSTYKIIFLAISLRNWMWYCGLMWVMMDRTKL